MADLKSPTVIWIKGILFLLLGLFASVLLLMYALSLKVALLLAVAVWAFCRFYYFAFYVIEHYVDSEYRFAGLLAFVQYALSKRRNDHGQLTHPVSTNAVSASEDHAMDNPPLKVIGIDELDPSVQELPWFAMLRSLYDGKDNAKLVTLIAHGFVELLVNTLVDAHCKNAKRINSSSRDFPHSIKLLLLNELGVISDYRFAALNYFRKLRNDAAHDPFFSIDMQKIKREFNQLSKKSPGSQHTLSATSYYEFCLYMVVLFWVDHQETFQPVFMRESPEMSAKKNIKGVD